MISLFESRVEDEVHLAREKLINKKVPSKFVWLCQFIMRVVANEMGLVRWFPRRLEP
jgi:hypothetical protein